MTTSHDNNATDIHQQALGEGKSLTTDHVLIEEIADEEAKSLTDSATWTHALAAIQNGSTTYSAMDINSVVDFPQRLMEPASPTPTSPDDDSDLPDPSTGYFLLYVNPPPDVRSLPDVRTNDDAIAAAKTIARDSAATVNLRHRTEDGTIDLGTAHPDGTFSRPAAPPTPS